MYLLLVTTLKAPFDKASDEYKTPDCFEPSIAKKISFFFTSFELIEKFLFLYFK